MNIGGIEAKGLLLEAVKFIGPTNELKLPEELAEELDKIIRSVDLLESSTEPPKKQIGRLKANFQTVLLAHFNKDIDLKLEALKQTNAAIKKFNRDNGAGAMLGKAIAGALFAHIRREEDGFDNQKVKQKPEPIRASDLEKKFSNYIQQMGLKLHASDEEIALITGVEVKASDKEDNRSIEFGEAMLQDTSSKISLVIRDPEKFTGFLESLEGKDLKAHTKGNLNQMVLAIEDQFLAVVKDKKTTLPIKPGDIHKTVEEIDHDQAILDKQAEEKLDGMLSILTKNKKMIKAFRKLEINTRSLESIIEATKNGILKEYSLAKEAGYFNEIGKGFDLRICHMDCTTESYPEILARRLNALGKIAKNPKAKELYQNCLEHEIKGLEIALNDMQAYTEGRFIGSFEGRSEVKHYQKVIPEIVEVAEKKLAELKDRLTP